MGLEVVVKDVLARGEEEANRIRQEGTDEANALIRGAENTARQILEERREQAVQQIERRKKTEKYPARILKLNEQYSNAKKELLDKAYNEALGALAALSEPERETIIKKQLESHTDSKRVFSNKSDESIVRRITELEYGGTIPCSGGVVLENEDGTVIHDLTFDTLIRSVRETSLKQLIEILNV